MSDYGHEQTDKELQRIEKLIAKEYAQAAKEVEAKMKKHFAEFDEKDKMFKKKLDAGDITQQQYNNWRMGQMAIGDRWKAVRDSMAQTLVNADVEAAKIIQGNSIKAYVDNMNYGTYEVETGSKINTGFVLYDAKTVENLLKEDPGIIPMPKPSIPKDEIWNRQKLTSAVTQGILQGESVSKIAERLAGVAAMDENAALRNARTYTTAAENKGRLDSYERAEKLGIKTNKKWIATLDEKTRMEHRHLDNMSVPYNEPFEVDGYTIEFPGDPNAEPEMFYNCRCTLVADIVGQNYNDERKDDKLDGMTYEEWKHAKDKQKTEEQVPDKLTKADIDKMIPTDIREKLDKLEEKYFDAKSEHYIAINKDGEQIFDSGKGGSRKVSVPKSVDEQMEGGFSYHNHTAEATFSVEDIRNYEKYGEHGFITDTAGNEHILYNLNPISKYEEVEKAARNDDDAKYAELMPFSTAAGKEYKQYDDQYWQDRREYSKELIANEPDSNKRIELLNEWGKDHPTPDEHMQAWLEENSQKYGFVYVKTSMNEETAEAEKAPEPKAEKTQAKEEPKEWIMHAEFTPAETVEEAEKYAKDNFIQGGFSITGKNMSYNGLELDMANAINERLNDIYSNFKVDKLASIETYGPKNKKFYEQHKDAPMSMSNFGNFMLNKEMVKNEKAVDKYIKEGNEAFEYVISNIDKLTGAKRELAEIYKEAGRSLVSENAADFATHEIGHRISYMKEVNEEMARIQKETDWKDYARNISGYANHSFGEYCAESFDAYYKGETDNLQPEMVAVFESLRR